MMILGVRLPCTLGDSVIECETYMDEDSTTILPRTLGDSE